jgi:hypothetical protein
MVSRIFPVTLFAALGLLVAWPATDVQAQARGGGRNNLFQYDASHPAYKDIQREESLGQEHIDGPVDYGTDFPTSGPHVPRPARPGFYDEPVALEALVHAMEHGSVIVYYGKPGDAAMKLIRGWTDQYQGEWDGVIAVPHEGLGEGVVLTAWRHRLEIPRMDVRASFFVDAFRGRGPENRVR